MKEFSRLRGRVLALGLLVAVIVGAYYSFVTPVLNWRSTNLEVIDSDQKALQRLSAFARIASPNNTDQGKILEQYRIDYLSSDTAVLAQAEMQNRIRSFTSRGTAQVTSAQVLATINREDLTLIGVRLQVQGPMAAIHQLLFEIESSEPLMFVNRATLRLSPHQANAVQPDTMLATQMLVDLDVYGALWPGIDGSSAASQQK